MEGSAGTEESALSARARQASAPAMSYLSDFFAALGNIYNPDTNPEGKIVLAVAENNLSFELLRPRIHELACTAMLPLKLAQYDNMKGIEKFRVEMARLLTNGRGFGGYAFDPAGFCVSAGCGAVLDNLMFLLCEAGDAVLIPSPYYPAFDNDLTVKAGAVPVSVPTPAPGHKITPALLDAAVLKCRDAGQRPRVLLLTNPHNPLGTILTKSEVRALVNWARFNQVHLISDEIYAFSVHSKDEEFASVSSVVALEDGEEDDSARLGDLIHIVYGFSKDFCMSGFRVGMLYSENKALHTALDNISYFCAVSNHTQFMLAGLLGWGNGENAEGAFIRNYLTENANRLGAAYRTLTEALKKARLRFIEASAGLFCMIDLTDLLPRDPAAAGWAGEKQLFKELLEWCGVLMTPGEDCHYHEPGWFRCCFAWVDGDHLRLAIERIANHPTFAARLCAAEAARSTNE